MKNTPRRRTNAIVPRWAPIWALLPLCLIAGCSGGPRAETPAASRAYAFWPQFPDEPRIQYVASYTSSEDVAPVQMTGLEKLVFGEESAKPALIQKPYGVAARDGKIYVTDMRSKALVVLDLRKKQTRLVGVSGFNQLEHPVAVAVAGDGMIYVADNARDTIFVFDAQERYSTVFGFPGFKPVGLAIHGERLYVADLKSQVVIIMDRRTGERLGEIGSVGDEDGQFRLPLGVATDADGNVLVMDMMRCRLQKFSPEGKLLSATGQLGDFAGAFARPKHLAVDADGIVYVVDASFQNVQMFDRENRLLMHFGASGNFPGSMDLPAGIAVTSDGLDLFKDKIHPGFEAKRLVVVSNQFGPNRVSIYAMGQVRAGYTAKDLASASVAVDPGVGVPSAEDLKLQTPGGIEQPLDPGSLEPTPDPSGQPVPPRPDQPSPKPSEPK